MTRAWVFIGAFESDILRMGECIEHATRRETSAATGPDQQHSRTELCSKEQRHCRREQCRKDECRQAETWRRPRAVHFSHRHSNRCAQQCREGDPQVTKVVTRPDSANERESKGNSAEQNRERLRRTLVMRPLHLSRPVLGPLSGKIGLNRTALFCRPTAHRAAGRPGNNGPDLPCSAVSSPCVCSCRCWGSWWHGANVLHWH
jgi:hypothetical protein